MGVAWLIPVGILVLGLVPIAWVATGARNAGQEAQRAVRRLGDLRPDVRELQQAAADLRARVAERHPR
jgi:phage host-nuclease inhibitor protein Gam